MIAKYISGPTFSLDKVYTVTSDATNIQTFAELF